jgi:hypothetical protein
VSIRLPDRAEKAEPRKSNRPRISSRIQETTDFQVYPVEYLLCAIVTKCYSYHKIESVMVVRSYEVLLFL